MKDAAFPGLFQSSDRAATTAQKAHVRLSALELGLLVAAAVASSLPEWTITTRRVSFSALLTSVALVATLVTGLLARTRRFAQRWFASRAIAESVRTESWRFMMKVGAYAAGDPESEKAFVVQLRALLEAQPEAQILLADHPVEATWITSEMRQTRLATLVERRTLYSKDRLENQRNWYKKGAARDATRESLWFWLTTGANSLAILLALLSIIDVLPLGTIGILTTAATGFIAWGELRDYRTQAQSYAMIYQELSALSALASNPATELENVVNEVERTISREHVLWLSRRTTAANK